jgi:bifunctional UDP-N-acetylglucosamine pyrophosphorylase / glucosamine-1-phosphate N-acetyltransferase
MDKRFKFSGSIFLEMDIVVLAAGLGKRMGSPGQSKVLHKVAGQPILHRICFCAQKLQPQKIVVVYHQQLAAMQAAVADIPNIAWAKQSTPKGTGDAVLAALPYCGEQQVLVICGDMPMLQATTLQQLWQPAYQNTLTVISMQLAQPQDYGRIVRNEAGQIQAIVEEKDATALEKNINEVNSGILSVPARFLREALPKLNDNNAQGEIYLPDLVAIWVEKYGACQGLLAQDPLEFVGVNNPEDLAKANALMKSRNNRSSDFGLVNESQ